MPSGPACGDCWGTFEDSWCTKFKWDDWCQKCQSDAAFNAEVQKSVDIRTGKTRRPFNDRRVEKITRSGCLVVSRYSLLKDKPFQEVTNGISAKLLQLTEDSVGTEDGNSTQRGVVIKKPGHELPEIIMYSDIFTQTVEVVAPAKQILRQEQSAETHRWVQQQVEATLAKSLRTHVSTATLADIETKAAAYLKIQKDKTGVQRQDGETKAGDAADEGKKGDADSEAEEDFVASIPQARGLQVEIARARMGRGRGKGRGMTSGAVVASRSSSTTGALGAATAAPRAPSRRLAEIENKTNDASAVLSAEALKPGHGNDETESVSHSIPKTGGRTTRKTEMTSLERAKDYEQMANPVEVLKGAVGGGNLCFQIKRYRQGLEKAKALEPGVEVILGRTVAIMEAAVELAPKSLPTLPEPRRNDQLRFLKSKGVALPVETQGKLIELKLPQCKLDRAYLVHVLQPWDAEDGAPFDGLDPRLCHMDLSEERKAALLLELVIQHVLLDYIIQGEASKEDVLDCAARFLKVLESRPKDKSKVVPAAFDDLRDVLHTFQVLLCPDPQRALDIASPKDVRRILSGESKNEFMKLMSDALDQSPWWKEQKAQYRMHVVSDITVGPELRHAMEELQKDTVDDAAISNIVSRLGHWLKSTRPGGTDKLQTALLTAMEKRCQIEVERNSADDGTEAEEALTKAQWLETQVVAVVRMLDTKAKYAEGFEAVRLAIIKRREQCALAHTETAAMTAIAGYLRNPTRCALPDLLKGVGDGTGTKLTGKVALEAVGKCLNAMLSVIGPTASLSSDLNDLNNFTDCAMGLLELISEPGEALQGLDMCWQTYKLAIEVHNADDALMSLGSAVDDRISHDNGDLVWSKLAAALDAFDTTVEGDEGFTSKMPDGDTLLMNIREQCDPILTQATVHRNEFAAAMTAWNDRDLEEKHNELMQFYHGMLDGTNWRESLAEDASFEDAVKQAELTVFKQKGLKGKLSAAIQDLSESIAYSVSDMVKYDNYQISAATLAEYNASIDVGRASSAEAALLQLLKGVTGTPSAAVQAKLGALNDQMAADGVKASLLLPAVWTKAQELLRAG